METWRSVVVTCCREVLGRSLVAKCVCVWGSVAEVIWRSVVEEVLW